MDQPRQNTQQQGYARTRSAAKASRPRSSTKGPLDADEVPLTSAQSPERSQAGPEGQPNPTGRSSPFSMPPVSSSRTPLSPTPPQAVPEPRDLSHLLRPEIYHPLTPVTIPVPFRNSPHQPSTDTPLPELLAKGHYRAAAIAAAQELTGTGTVPSPSPTDHARIFDLIYIRLACLTLCGATATAAQEVRALEDPSTVITGDPSSPATSSNQHHPWPWPLRVLAVRLQALGFGDLRRAVARYYELAAEARSRLVDAARRADLSARELWRARLADLGVRVAGALVEMDDLPGAAAQLASLPGLGPGDSDDSESGGGGGRRLAFAKALLWLHVGDVEAAKGVVGASAGVGPKVIDALCAMADGEYDRALPLWGELRDEQPDDEMIGVNTAVCLLYVGKMQEGRKLLEDLVSSGCTSHTLLFNLTTMYELCTERSRVLKLQLAERVAAIEPTSMGWEKGNADFKL
ncbi:hypothetical protein VTK73DRAFT_1557 [Phialemonium thermophilum]|uniref:Trafficking protein particle complex subunit 12 n=1 Tax=Phialemonium thermophilum TaxID=223376 RepID=A0ABR3X8P2_9PEZI